MTMTKATNFSNYILTMFGGLRDQVHKVLGAHRHQVLLMQRPEDQAAPTLMVAVVLCRDGNIFMVNTGAQEFCNPQNVAKLLASVMPTAVANALAGPPQPIVSLNGNGDGGDGGGAVS
jgi:hypothetical protein